MVIELPRDFSEFLRLLNDRQVRYLVIGGYAVGYHGYPRATNDLDVWIAIAPDNAARVVEALEDFGFGSAELTTDLFLKEDSIIRMGLPPMRIEILTTISGVSFETCYQDRVEGVFGGTEVTLISLDDLKRNKRASGRYKDLDDLEHLP
ncbi:MAG TPA: hypothetical protein PLR07_08180 [Promineifilum sp.]|nr:hypothetical protein [Promineifilum sp.]